MLLLIYQFETFLQQKYCNPHIESIVSVFPPENTALTSDIFTVFVKVQWYCR